MGFDRDTWPEEQLRRLCEDLRNCAKGERNNQLFRVSARMGDYVADGTISGDAVHRELSAAAHEAGLSGKEVGGTISSGIERGNPGQAFYPSGGGGGISELMERRRRLHRQGLPAVEALPSVHVTSYKHMRDPQGVAALWSWEDIADACAGPLSEPSKDRTPLWGFHDIENDSRARIPTENERSRSPVVRCLTALALDYDDDPTFSASNVRRWWGAVQHVAHTTRHHQCAKDDKPEAPRGRVIVALSRPVTHDEVQELLPWLLDGRVGKPAEPELKSSARAYFVPVMTETYWHSAHLTGSALDVDEVLNTLRDAGGVEGGGVEDHLEMMGGDNPRPRPSVRNVVTVLELDDVYDGAVRFNEFSSVVEYRGAAIRDVDEAIISVDVGERFDLRVSSTKVSEAVSVAAEMNRYHPVREYLRSLSWDGGERLSGWLTRYAGCEDSPLVCEYGLRWMIGAVARIMRPGCKMDNTLILVGDQGGQKSTMLRVLAGGDAWFADATIDVRNKDAYAVLQGKWIYEWAELDSMRRGDATAIKSYLTSQSDHYRPAYGRHAVTMARQTVFVGTTNEATFLTDSTGSRRFWPVLSGEIDIPGITADRDQLWAEAVALFTSGARWWLDDAAEVARSAEAAGFSHSDPWLEQVAKYTKNATPCTVAEVLHRALGKEGGTQTKSDAMRVAGILQELGLTKRRTRRDARLVTVWA